MTQRGVLVLKERHKHKGPALIYLFYREANVTMSNPPTHQAQPKTQTKSDTKSARPHQQVTQGQSQTKTEERQMAGGGPPD